MRNQIINSNGGRRQSRPVINENQMSNILPRGRGSLTKAGETTARGWGCQRLGITKNNNAVLIMAGCLLAGVGFSVARAAQDNSPGSDRTGIAASTNAAPVASSDSPVGSIAADLQRLQARITKAVWAMSNAATSNPAQQTAKVTKLADEITELGTKDLGDEGEIVKQADRLIAKFNEAMAKARKGASDPNVGPSARAIYGPLGPRIEAELAKLIDAKSTVARIRTELLRQAEGLRQSADAIGFAEHYYTLEEAAQAFRATLTEVTKFTEKISLLIQSIGKGGPVPLT